MNLHLNDSVALVAGGTGGDTSMMRQVEVGIFGEDMAHEKAMALVAGSALDKRYAHPEEIATAILYLSSDVSSHTAGIGLRVDANAPGVI